MSANTAAELAARRADEEHSTPDIVVGVALARLYGEPLFKMPEDLYIPPEALEIFLEAFEGPLDLLLYLVENRDRVVGKEELLDSLWPGVIVTESSLQRAVSLARAALQQGGLREAIRNYARRGYRFLANDSPPAAETRRTTRSLPRSMNRMTPSAFQVPPRPMVTSQIVCGGPPSTSIRLSLPREKKPIDLLSGDQNG